MERFNSDNSDQQLVIGQRALERTLQEVLEKFRSSEDYGNGEFSEDCRRVVSDNVSSCCCSRRCYDGIETPTFSLDFSKATSCNISGSNADKTASRNKRVLQIHLPESSKEPCQILITSNRDQVTIKYLKQGQQFTFTSSKSCDEMETSTGDDNINGECVRAESESITSSIRRESEDTPIQQNGDNFVNGDLPGNLQDTKFISSLQEDQLNGNNSDLPAAKKQKKESLNTFIDSLLTKRTLEEGRKSLDSVTIGSDSETSHGRPLEIVEDSTLRETIEAPFCAPEEISDLTIQDFPSQPLSVRSEMSANTSILQKTDSFAKQITVEKPTPKKGRFKCQYCSMLFEQRGQCLVHISQEHGEDRPHHCPLCDATFKKRRSLLYHVRHHNGERPYKCTYCDKAFKEKYHLTVHIRTHTGERPFACNQCGKAFKQTNELTSHIRTHTGERPYKCNLCDKWFKRRTQLYNHNLSHFANSALTVQENSISTEAIEQEKSLEVLPLDGSMD